MVVHLFMNETRVAGLISVFVCVSSCCKQQTSVTSSSSSSSSSTCGGGAMPCSV